MTRQWWFCKGQGNSIGLGSGREEGGGGGGGGEGRETGSASESPVPPPHRTVPAAVPLPEDCQEAAQPPASWRALLLHPNELSAVLPISVRESGTTTESYKPDPVSIRAHQEITSVCSFHCLGGCCRKLKYLLLLYCHSISHGQLPLDFFQRLVKGLPQSRIAEGTLWLPAVCRRRVILR